MANKVTVLVTGFGPFGQHKINASWEAVKELDGIGFENNINLITQEIPVKYKMVSSLVPDLWQKHKPKLCVHVGVSPITNVMQLEMCAHNTDYCREDVSCKLPDGYHCVPNGQECLHTNVDVKKICEERDESKCPCELETSCDAGRYLCEFIYYSSLSQSKRPEYSGSSVIFIHVPTLDNPYNKTQLAHALKYVVLDILKQQNSLEQCQKY